MAFVKVLGRLAAALTLVVLGFVGLSAAASAQDVDPYPTTTEGPDVSASTVVQDDDTIPVDTTDVEAEELADTGSESGRVALLGLAALGTGGVCIAAARRRATN